MSSYHFPIILGQNKSERIVIVHLIDDQEDYEEKRVVITNPGGPSDPIFCIFKHVKIVDEYGKGEKNIIVDDGDIKPRRLNNAVLLQVCIDGELTPPKTDKKHPEYYCFYYPKDKFDGIVEFHYKQYGEDKKQPNLQRSYDGKLHIVRPSRNDTLLRLTADLGSDATQVNYVLHKRGRVDERPLSINLIENMKIAYGDGANSRSYSNRPANFDEPLFIQEEKHNPSFYKTGNITFRHEGYLEKGINEGDCFINYLSVSSAAKNENYSTTTWTIENEFDKKLINIKMLYSELGTQGSPVVQKAVNFGFKEKGNANPVFVNQDPNSLLQVLQTIYKQIIDVAVKQFENEGCEYYSIMLLAPNIYSQKNIDNLLNNLNSLMNDDYANNTQKIGQRKLYDFRIISESDSAFLGLKEVGDGNNVSIIDSYLNRQGIKDKKKKEVFLVIDAGKGTTDYSIIRYSKGMGGAANNLVTSLDRNGIVGAGGAIDYVFARIFARQIYRHRNELVENLNKDETVDEAGFITDFMTMIQDLYPVDQDRMMLIVESLKKSYNWKGNNYEMAKMYQCFKNGEAKKIISLLLQKPEKRSFALNDISTHYTDGLAEIAKCNLDGFDNDKEAAEEIDKQEVKQVCEAIANAIINDQVFKDGDTTVTKSIDYVIFTGRSFLFEPLKKAFKDAIKSRKGINKENYSGWIQGGDSYFYDKFKAMIRGKDSVKEHWNLQIADDMVRGIDMKPISVMYHDHNLGFNCNSNLCCIKGLAAPNKKQEIVRKERFWQGFKGGFEDHKADTYFYIGYSEHSFGCSDSEVLDNANKMHTDYKNKEDLIKMTLFPVRYQPVRGIFEQSSSATSANRFSTTLSSNATSLDIDNCDQQQIKQ